MKKLVLGAAVAVAMIGGAAQAAITLDVAGKVVVTPADTYEIYLSGASAAQNYVEQLVTSPTVIAADRMCDSTLPVYKFTDAGTAGAEQRAYYCTLNPLNPQLVGLAGGKTNLLIYKRNKDGSLAGVGPIVDDAKGLPSASIKWMLIDPTVCTVPAAGAIQTSSCTYNEAVVGQFQDHVPDLGISDVDPKQFTGDNTSAAFPTAVSDADLALLTVSPAGSQVHGIGVTLKLRQALQEAQFPVTSTCNPTNAGYSITLPAAKTSVGESEACMPSLSHDLVASILLGKLDTWADVKVGATDLVTNTSLANKPGNPRVHVCTRTNGSGTRAVASINFLSYPCTGGLAKTPAADTGAAAEVIAKTQVHAMLESGDLQECLRELDGGVNTIGTKFNNTYVSGGSRWAIGISGTEKNAGLSEAWRFVKIDGVAPTLANVVAGKYHDWAELTFQVSKTHVWDAGDQAIVTELIKAGSNPVVIQSLNSATSLQSFGDAGYLASPINSAPNVNGSYVAATPVNPLSHATTTDVLNNCRVPTAYNLSAPANSGLQLF